MRPEEDAREEGEDPRGTPEEVKGEEAGSRSPMDIKRENNPQKSKGEGGPMMKRKDEEAVGRNPRKKEEKAKCRRT